AFAQLGTHDVVLGPVYDGGYYLIGVRGGHDVLGGIAMSTATVLEQIVARCHALGLSVGRGETTFDVDDQADLLHLLAELERGPAGPATRAAIDELGLA